MATAVLARAVPVSRSRNLVDGMRMIRAALSNPLDGLPPEVFTAPILHRRVLGRSVVFAMAPELIHEALVTRSDALDKGEVVQRLLRPALGNGLLTAEGADWKWQRRALAPVFRAAGLSRFQPAMVAAAAQTRDRLAAQAGAGPVAVNEAMMRATFDVIVQTMLSDLDGIEVEETANAITAYLHNTRWANLSGMLGLPEWMPHPGKRFAHDAAAGLRGRLMDGVTRRRRAGAALPDTAGGGTLVDVLLAASDPETGRRMTDAEVVDNLLTFLTAGHETTALGLAWTLDLLGRHPEVAQMVHEEAVAIGPDAPDGLRFTTQVFQEALRLYPAAPLILRRVATPFSLGGIDMEAGTRIMVPIHAVHRHAALWDAPHVFDPARFAPDAVRARPRHAFMPFGAGPRVCIGAGFAVQEAVTILATLLRDLRFVSLQPVPPAPRLEITLRPSTPLLMRVEPRRPA